MVFVATALGFSNFLTSGYIAGNVEQFMDAEFGEFSGLFVQADGLGYEGEPRNLAEEEDPDQYYVAGVTQKYNETSRSSYVEVDGVLQERLFVSSMGYVEINSDIEKAFWCKD
jgi:hypothetical protein